MKIYYLPQPLRQTYQLKTPTFPHLFRERNKSYVDFVIYLLNFDARDVKRFITAVLNTKLNIGNTTRKNAIEIKSIVMMKTPV